MALRRVSLSSTRSSRTIWARNMVLLRRSSLRQDLPSSARGLTSSARPQATVSTRPEARHTTSCPDLPATGFRTRSATCFVRDVAFRAAHARRILMRVRSCRGRSRPLSLPVAAHTSVTRRPLSSLAIGRLRRSSSVRACTPFQQAS